MAYATLDDVQDRLPTQVWEIGVTEQPSSAAVSGWLEAQTRFLNGTLAWKYSVPVTDASDLAVLRQVCAALVAAEVYDLLAMHDPANLSNPARNLRQNAYQQLAYDAKSGQAHLVLSGTALSESGEADVGSPEGSFTDPDAEGSEPRLFPDELEF